MKHYKRILNMILCALAVCFCAAFLACSPSDPVKTHTVTVDGLIIDDSKAEEGGGICFFGNPNPDRTDEAAERAMPYPYAVTENLRVRNLTTVSGREVALSKNPFMFRNLRVSGIE